MVQNISFVNYLIPQSVCPRQKENKLKYILYLIW